MQAALTAHKGEDGTARFRRVWMWSDDWPGKTPQDGVDTGIDLVAEQHDGQLCSIQCKFYKGQITTGDIDSFLAASGRPEFGTRIIAHTGTGFQRHGLNKMQQAHPVCEVFDLDRMGGWKCDWWDVAEKSHAVSPGTPRRTVRQTGGRRLTRWARAGAGIWLRHRDSTGRRWRQSGRRGGAAGRLIKRVWLAAETVVVSAVWAALMAAAAVVVLAVLAAYLALRVVWAVLAVFGKLLRPRRRKNKRRR